MLCLDKPKIEAGQEAICARFLLEGQLKLISPLIIGGGSSLYGDSDIVILKDESRNPYIPSSSITGVLKHQFDKYQYQGSEDNYEQNKLWFWGGEYKFRQEDGECVRRSCQSSMIISDLRLPETDQAQISIRDGIRINRKSGVVDQGAKFDFEIIEPGISFAFRMEVIVRKAFNKDLFQAFFNWIASQLSTGQIAIGARTAQGFGRCRLENLTSYIFDYQRKEDLIYWLAGDWDKAQQAKIDYSQVNSLFKYRYGQFRVQADFRIKDSLIVGSYSGDPKAPDKVHLKSTDGCKKTAVIPGTSMRGSIRSRAEKIVNTLGLNYTNGLKELFGWVDSDPGSNSKSFKGKIKVEEKPITINSYVEEIQHRIRIDRFTGGVINNALFDSMPIWSSEGDEHMVSLELIIDDYKEWEAGLMLLVLKDLWTGDLAIGGEKSIGRGILEGQRAIVSFDNRQIILEQKADRLVVRDEHSNSDWDKQIAQELENLVKAFLKPDFEAEQGSEVLSRV